MNIMVTLSKIQAWHIYNYIFSNHGYDLIVTENGRVFMLDLAYPMSCCVDEPRPWMFSSKSVTWFLTLVKRELKENKENAIDDALLSICRSLGKDYVDLLYTLVPGDDKCPDNGKQPRVDPFAGTYDPEHRAGRDPFGEYNV